MVLGLSKMNRTLIAICLVASAGATGVRVQSPRSQWNGVYTEQQAARGEALYVDNCIRCHGTNLSGTVLAPAVAGSEFLTKWNGKPLSLVFNIIQTRMPWNLSGHLSPQQNADVLAYMLKKSDGPTGPEELPSRAEALSTVRLLDKMP
jgi:mono/diheme cytochrome c family protein